MPYVVIWYDMIWYYVMSYEYDMMWYDMNITWYDMILHDMNMIEYLSMIWRWCDMKMMWYELYDVKRYNMMYI